MSTRFMLASAAVMFAAVAASAQKPTEAAAKAPALVVGAPAPALTIEKWVKGAPVANFEKGKTYVVEFWATWCGPCVASMPHLSALQREYKDKGVTFIGVTSMDKNGNDLPKVEAMVKDKGDGMDYTVAWDSQRTTADSYMKAAGQNGIPCSFVIDGTGKIVYIGHPMWLDLPMEQIVAGKWDVEKGNAAIKDAESSLNGIYTAVRKEPKSALGKITDFEKKYPAYAMLVASLKFDSMLGAGEYDAAYKFGSELVDAAIAHKNAVDLNDIAWKIVDPDAKLEKRDLDLAMRAAEKAVAFTSEKDGAVIDTLARVWFLKGDLKKAVEWQTKAAAASTGEMKKQLEATLAEYKSKQAQ